ncbi:MAG TPA: hypothetical protein VJ552_10350 [Sediminibacterium sp.]|nr:hypothetical protein [Sediminibacterium sp.]
MRPFLFLLSGMLFSMAAFSQNISILQDPLSSRIFNIEKYAEIRGTPFLADKWTRGSVTTTKGVYENLELKYNVYDNALFFNKNEEAFELQDEIVSFTLMHKPGIQESYSVYKKGVTGSGLSAQQFVQVLAEGGVDLYRLDLKHVSEMSEVNAGIVKTFTGGIKYYVKKDKAVTLIKADKESALLLLADKADQVKNYITSNRISFRKEEDLIKVFKYYNAL